jgi:hypothetical protein
MLAVRTHYCQCRLHSGHACSRGALAGAPPQSHPSRHPCTPPGLPGPPFSPPSQRVLAKASAVAPMDAVSQSSSPRSQDADAEAGTAPATTDRTDRTYRRRPAPRWGIRLETKYFESPTTPPDQRSVNFGLPVCHTRRSGRGTRPPPPPRSRKSSLSCCIGSSCRALKQGPAICSGRSTRRARECEWCGNFVPGSRLQVADPAAVPGAEAEFVIEAATTPSVLPLRARTPISSPVGLTLEKERVWWALEVLVAAGTEAEARERLEETGEALSAFRRAIERCVPAEWPPPCFASAL